MMREKCEVWRRKDKNNEESLYLELDVVHRWGCDHTVEGGEAMLIANLLAVQLKLGLPHLPVHIQGYHRLRRETERMHNTAACVSKKETAVLTSYLVHASTHVLVCLTHGNFLAERTNCRGNANTLRQAPSERSHFHI